MSLSQSEFYKAQQTRFQQVEPNRILGRRLGGSADNPLGTQFVDSAKTLLSRYDPYLQKSDPMFSAEAIQQVFTGQNETTAEEQNCRGYNGLAGLQLLLREQSADPYATIRCGWRYKPSTNMVPDVAQGALGTRVGPVNTNTPEDRLGNGVEWIWDLQAAQKRMLTDIGQAASSPDAYRVMQTIAGGTYAGQLGYCKSTGITIPIQNGRPLYPDTPNLNCPQSDIVIEPSQLPTQPANVTGPAAQQAAIAQQVLSCQSNSPLTRDCFLQAIRNNGCSDQGTLYMSLQMASPIDSRWDGYLNQTPAFTAYQSKQGANGLTDSLFQRNRGTWEMAVADVNRLRAASQTAADKKVLIAAQDLCQLSGTYDTYDFCADIPDGTDIQLVDLKCIQNYWQNSGGKPAGLLYPKSLTISTAQPSILTSRMTWGSYKSAVNLLKNQTITGDASQQRTAIQQFYGITVGMQAFSPTLPGLQFWIDAMDGSKIGVTSTKLVRYWNDKSGRNAARDLTQLTPSAQPTYVASALNGKPGIRFSGAQFLDMPNLTSVVTTNNFTIFFVEQRYSNSQNYIFGGTTASANQNLHVGYRSDRYPMFGYWSNDLNLPNTISSSLSATGPDIARIWTLKATTTGRSMRINGKQLGTDGNRIALTGWSGARLGSTASSYFYNGMIYEMLIFQPALGDTDVQAIEGYLATKWGILSNLDPTHPYRVGI